MPDKEWISRTRLLMGEDKLNRLINANILIVGLGGVGAYAAEQLCRAGICSFTIVDGDIFQPSNRNRQLPALISTEGKAKPEVVKNRLLDINADVKITAHKIFLDETNIESIFQKDYNYVVDAIDTLTPKIQLIKKSLETNIPLVSSMGSGGKKDPSLVQISDISESYSCKLAFMLRKKLHRIGIYKGFKVVFSPETVDKESIVITINERNKRSNVGTISYMPAIFGCFLASAVINDLIAR